MYNANVISSVIDSTLLRYVGLVCSYHHMCTHECMRTV